MVFSIPWDIHAIQTRIWHFPKDTNLGILIFSIPVEEFLFMMTITLMVASITIVAKYKFNKNVKI
ncbi:lycopene cyclase domain-containing protein [Candidatus Gottesmanbacteria bacterium]|nr:lycopene cyclase domain-containing protein [Candidatus Gottesmanbacteria bacterium]